MQARRSDGQARMLHQSTASVEQDAHHRIHARSSRLGAVIRTHSLTPTVREGREGGCTRGFGCGLRLAWPWAAVCRREAVPVSG